MNWEHVCLCALVYMCLSIVEGLPGAVQVLMCMGVRALCSHTCICPQPVDGFCLFSMHLVYIWMCAHPHICARKYRHIGVKLRKEKLLDFWLSDRCYSTTPWDISVPKKF